MKKLLFIVGTHGNEHYSISVIKKLRKEFKSFDYIIGNPKAIKTNVRFIESDLNRVFPGKKCGTYEEKRALKIFNYMQAYDYVVDIHGVPKQKHEPFIILCNEINRVNSFKLAELLPIPKTVIWESLQSKTGPSVKLFKGAGFEIEYGLNNIPKAKYELERTLRIFLENINMQKTKSYKKIIYRVIGKVSELPHILNRNIDSFKPIKAETTEYIPILPYAYKRTKDGCLFVNVEKLSKQKINCYLSS
ncbi:MAG: succinylglutamate desuccinylase/aspartoacylase family protein [Patescibacteria group bacterium]